MKEKSGMTEDIKNKIKLKNTFYRQYMRHQTQTSLVDTENFLQW